MTASVIHLRKRRIIKPPHLDSTAVAAPPAADAPMVETTLMETLAIKRFLTFALQDIKYQLEMMARDKTMALKHFNENKTAALLISEYLVGLIKDIDENLAEGAPKIMPGANEPDASA